MVTHSLPSVLGTIELRGYIDEKENKRFVGWLEGLNAAVAAKVTIAGTDGAGKFLECQGRWLRGF